MADYIATHPYYSNDPVPQPTIPSAKLWLLPMQQQLLLVLREFMILLDRCTHSCQLGSDG